MFKLIGRHYLNWFIGSTFLVYIRSMASLTGSSSLVRFIFSHILSSPLPPDSQTLPLPILSHLLFFKLSEPPTPSPFSVHVLP